MERFGDQLRGKRYQGKLPELGVERRKEGHFFGTAEQESERLF